MGIDSTGNGCGSKAPSGWLPNFVPSLGRVSSGDEGLAELILRVDSGDFLRRPILERPVRPTLVVFPPPGLDPLFGFVQ